MIVCVGNCVQGEGNVAEGGQHGGYQLVEDVADFLFDEWFVLCIACISCNVDEGYYQHVK